MATIKALKTKLEDGTEQVVFPKTLPEAIIDSKTGKTLDVVLDEISDTINNIEITGGGGTTYELSRTEDTITLTGSDGSSSEITDSSAYLSRENLLVYPYHDNTSTIYGVTFTVNNDGTITANGESTSSYSVFSISTRHADSNPLIVLPKGTYTLSGCPTGGGETTYCIQIGIDSNGSWKTIATDTGNGAIFTLTEETQIAINCPIMSGVTVENLIFKPMLEVGTVAHEYQPYNLSRQKLRSDLDSINTDVNVSDKVSKSGDTMTGDLTVKANVNIPLLADNSDTTMATVPTAGTVDIGSTEQKITDVLTSYKSFMGSIHTKDAWNNIISTRHRNGASDGVSHGMYLRSLMNRSTPDLTWAVQAAGTWQSERAILDSGNYSNYALPLSGGTVTGATTFSSLLTTSNGSVVARQANEANWGDKGYVVLAKIVVKRKYMSNSNLMLTLSSFGDRTRAEGKIYVQFGNVGTAASTTVLKVSTCGTPAIYYVLTSDTSADTATLELIATKAGYENFAIINISTSSHFRARADITFPMTFESSLRSGAIAATTYTMLDSDNYSTQIPSATQSAVGLMSAADKKKLDGIASGANAYSLPTASSSTLGGVKTTSKVTSTSGLTACPIISGVPYYKDTNTTYSAATTSANGLMTAAMVTKLNGIATGATKVTVDSAMSSSSTNPVQNKVVKGQLPTSNQNATNGYIRFPSAKIQIAWIKKSVTTTITTVWGKTYETESAVDIGSWAAAFSSVPVVSYDTYVSEGSCDLSVNKFAGPTATTAGSVYLARASALTPARTFVVTAFAVGTYA